jgi:TatD DNase family protein
MAASLTDSHCHLNFELLRNNLPQVLQNARESGVGHMLCVGVTIEKLPEVLALAHEYPNIFASVGVHPDEQQGHDPSIEELVQLAQDTRVVAIGETGLDYYRIKGDMTWQQDRFRRHIRAACVTGKPLIIHTREAAADTIRILKEEGADTVGGVMHCFTEGWDIARAALDLGFYISFSGIVTFRNAESLRDVARQVPADRLLVETDAPYLAPAPHRGKTNEPAFVRYVAEQLATLRNISLDELANTTTNNFFSLFHDAQPLGIDD